MPILANAKKALRQSKKRAETNNALRSRVRTAAKKLNKTPSVESLSSTFSAIDIAVKKHVMHRNKANRLKSQASAALAKSGQPAVAVAKPKPAAKKKTVAKSAVKKAAKSTKKTKAK